MGAVASAHSRKGGWCWAPQTLQQAGLCSSSASTLWPTLQTQRWNLSQSKQLNLWAFVWYPEASASLFCRFSNWSKFSKLRWTKYPPSIFLTVLLFLKCSFSSEFFPFFFAYIFCQISNYYIMSHPNSASWIEISINFFKCWNYLQDPNWFVFLAHLLWSEFIFSVSTEVPSERNSV